MVELTLLLAIFAAVLLGAIFHRLGETSEQLRRLHNAMVSAIDRWEAKEHAVVGAAKEEYHGGASQIAHEEWMRSHWRKHAESDRCGACGIDLNTAPSVWFTDGLKGYCSRDCIGPLLEIKRRAHFARIAEIAALERLEKVEPQPGAQRQDRKEVDWKEASELERGISARRARQLNPDYPPNKEAVLASYSYSEETRAFLAEAEAMREAALDQAVLGIREAERMGRLAPDPRTDSEMRESVREMWQKEYDEGKRNRWA